MNNEGLKREVIGRVMLKPRGVWNAKLSYNVLDCVVRNGSSYVCVSDTTTSIAPEFDKNGEQWMLLCAKGDKGDTGEKGEVGTNAPNFIGEWTPQTRCRNFDCVYYKGSTWLCLLPENMAVTNPPTLNSENWRLICKGSDYTLGDDGELIFYDSSKKVSGVRTSTNYVTHGEKQLYEVINDMQTQIDYLTGRLKAYGLYSDGFEETDDYKKK